MSTFPTLHVRLLPHTLIASLVTTKLPMDEILLTELQFDSMIMQSYFCLFT